MVIGQRELVNLNNYNIGIGHSPLYSLMQTPNYTLSKCSEQCFCDGSCKKLQEKALDKPKEKKAM